jgi:hypothetical protein
MIVKQYLKVINLTRQMHIMVKEEVLQRKGQKGDAYIVQNTMG